MPVFGQNPAEKIGIQQSRDDRIQSDEGGMNLGMDGRCGKIVMGVYGINIDEKMGQDSFEYLIADPFDGKKDVPEGYVVKTVPSFTWAVFPCKGAMPDALKDVNTKIFSEWLPALKEYEFAAGYCVEYYEDPSKYAKGTMDENYYCEIWIPIKQK